MSDTKTDTIKEHKFTPKQKKVLRALEDNLGVVTQACQDSAVARGLFYQWKNQIPEFARIVEDIQEVALDFVENMAFERVKEKSDTMIIFYLKTKGKGRGYIEKSMVDVTSNGESVIFNRVIEPKADDSTS